MIFKRLKIKKLLKQIGKYFLYLLLSILLAVAIRVFLFNFYHIPSDSMTPTILPGDFMAVEKWSYGARIFTGLDFDDDSDPPTMRCAGLSNIRRNDVVVFNYPYRTRRNEIRMNTEVFYVKRCVGLPGDSLYVADGFYRILGLPDTVGCLPGQRRLAAHKDLLNPSVMRTFPKDSAFLWDILNFGPLYIPKAGTTILLTAGNFILYRRQIAYETDEKVVMRDSSVYIGSTPAHTYTFRSNWYFMAGDNAVNSRDSRYFSIVPEAYIIGKAVMILSSKDPTTGKRRWNRWMKKIH